MKRAFAPILIFILLLVCCSCSDGGGSAYPITVNGTPVDGEVFRYYLNEAWNSPEVSGREGVINLASQLCIRYVAVNSTFEEAGLSLTPGEKAEANSRANILWRSFGEYYKGIGVSKQTYLKINLSEEYKEKLRLSFFDKGGADEIGDDVLRGWLKEYYLAFRLISAPLSSSDVYGNPVPLTDDEREEIEKSYSENAGALNAGADFDNVCKILAKDVASSQQAMETIVMSSESTDFSEAFRQSVKSVEEGRAGLFEDREFIYLIYRTDILSDKTIFENYRSECLKQASEAPLQSKIDAMCGTYASKRNSRLAGQYYDEIAKVKKNG